MTMNDSKIALIVSLVNSGAYETVRKLNMAKLRGAQPVRVSKLVDSLPETVQRVFNTLISLPPPEQEELCSIAVAVGCIISDLLDFSAPYPLTLLTGRQIRNKGLFPGSVADISLAIETVLQADDIPVRLSFRGEKRMIGM